MLMSNLLGILIIIGFSLILLFAFSLLFIELFIIYKENLLELKEREKRLEENTHND